MQWGHFDRRLRKDPGNFSPLTIDDSHIDGYAFGTKCLYLVGSVLIVRCCQIRVWQRANSCMIQDLAFLREGFSGYAMYWRRGSCSQRMLTFNVHRPGRPQRASSGHWWNRDVISAA